MSKLKVKAHPNDKRNTGTYVTTYTRFAFVSSPKKGREQCAMFLSCRDRMHEVVRSYIHKGYWEGFNPVEGVYDYKIHPPIDMDRLRLVFSRDFKGEQSVDEYKEKLFSGKRILNFYEDLAGWKKSKIATVDHSTAKYAWLLTGPGEWMRYPQALSLATFIMKLVTEFGPAKFKDEKSLQKFYKGVIDEHVKLRSYAKYLNHCYEKFAIIMKNYDELFIGELEKVYPKNNTDGFHWGGGIVALCEPNHCYDTLLVSRLDKLVRKNKSS